MIFKVTLIESNIKLASIPLHIWYSLTLFYV